jgi:hypothetical protein
LYAVVVGDERRRYVRSVTEDGSENIIVMRMRA